MPAAVVGAGGARARVAKITRHAVAHAPLSTHALAIALLRTIRDRAVVSLQHTRRGQRITNFATADENYMPQVIANALASNACPIGAAVVGTWGGVVDVVTQTALPPWETLTLELMANAIRSTI